MIVLKKYETQTLYLDQLNNWNRTLEFPTLWSHWTEGFYATMQTFQEVRSISSVRSFCTSQSDNRFNRSAFTVDLKYRLKRLRTENVRSAVVVLPGITAIGTRPFFRPHWTYVTHMTLIYNVWFNVHNCGICDIIQLFRPIPSHLFSEIQKTFDYNTRKTICRFLTRNTIVFL